MLAPAFYRRALCLAVPALLSARPAHAQSPDATGAASGPLALSWTSSDPSCDGASVAARALELVARGVTPRPTEAQARVTRDGDQWLVDLETRSDSSLGRRTLRGESCQELQQAIALLLAMIMESEAKAAPAPPPALPPAPAPVPAPTLGPSLDSGLPPEHDEPPRIPPPAPPRRGWGGVMRAHGLAALGLQPGLGLGVGGALGGAWGPFELLVSGAYWPSTRVSIFDRDGLLEMDRKVLGLTACYEVWSAGPLRALPCVSPELMWLEWRPLGLRVTNEGRTNHIEALTAYLDLRTEVFGPVFISILPGFTWEHPRPFRAKKCEDCNASDVFQLWGIGPILGAGVGARF
jgi:hypothetical protein